MIFLRIVVRSVPLREWCSVVVSLFPDEVSLALLKTCAFEGKEENLREIRDNGTT